MALGHSPQTVTNGLVFYYDMGNPQKSWKGAPTTNAIQTNLNLYDKDNGCTVTQLPETFEGNPIYRVVFPAGTLPRIRTTFAYTTGQQYTGSIYYKVIAQGSHTPQLIFRENGFGTTYTSTALTSTSWQRTNITHTFSGSGTSMFLLYQSSSAATTPTTIDFSMPQTELRSFATPFVNGTRSNTEAIIDLIGNRTATISPDLTYTNDNKFEFDGINDRILVDTQYPLSWNDPFSLEAVIRIPTGADWHDTTAGSNSGTSIVARGSYSGSHGLLRADTQTFRFWTRTNSGSYASIFSNAQYDTWYHLTGTYNGLINSLYVNGSLVSSVDVVKSGIPDSGSWQIGGGVAFGGNTGKYGKGEIPVAKIYNRALSAAEVQQNFNALRGRYGL
jgi:hypothetical protein